MVKELSGSGEIHKDYWWVPFASNLSKVIKSSRRFILALVGRAGWEREKALRLGKRCSSTAKILLCYQCCLSHKSRTQHQRGCHAKKLTPSLPDPIQAVFELIWITSRGKTWRQHLNGKGWLLPIVSSQLANFY